MRNKIYQISANFMGFSIEELTPDSHGKRDDAMENEQAPPACQSTCSIHASV
jgi:hypothetical protein